MDLLDSYLQEVRRSSTASPVSVDKGKRRGNVRNRDGDEFIPAGERGKKKGPGFDDRSELSPIARKATARRKLCDLPDAVFHTPRTGRQDSTAAAAASVALETMLSGFGVDEEDGEVGSFNILGAVPGIIDEEADEEEEDDAEYESDDSYGSVMEEDPHAEILLESDDGENIFFVRG